MIALPNTCSELFSEDPAKKRAASARKNRQGDAATADVERESGAKKRSHQGDRHHAGAGEDEEEGRRREPVL